MLLFDPEALANVPLPVLSQICQQASLAELQEIAAHQRLRDRLKKVITLITDDPAGSWAPDSHFATFHDFPTVPLASYTKPMRHPPVSLVDIRSIEHIHFASLKDLLHNSRRKIVALSDTASALWKAPVKLFRCTVSLNKLLRVLDEHNTVVVLPRWMKTLELKGNHLAFLSFWKAAPLRSLILSNVTVMGDNDPFALLDVEEMILDVIPQETLDAVDVTRVHTLKIFSRGKNCTSEVNLEATEYESVLALSLSHLCSTSLHTIHVQGLSRIADWNIPSLRNLKVEMSALTDEGQTFPRIESISLPALERFEATTPSTYHKCHDIVVPASCESFLTVTQLHKEKWVVSTDELWRDGIRLHHLTLTSGTFPRVNSATFKHIKSLSVSTDTRQDQQAVFSQQYGKLESLTWNVIGGPEIASIATMRPICQTLTTLNVNVECGVRIHMDLFYVQRCFPNVKTLNMKNCYYNRKLITVRDTGNVLVFPKLESMTLIEFPEEVLYVLEHIEAPRLKKVHIVTDGSPLSFKTNFKVKLRGPSSLETFTVKRPSAVVSNFNSMARNVFFYRHPKLTNVVLEHFNTVEINKCPALAYVEINSGKAPLNNLLSDGLPVLRLLKYPALGISRSATYTSAQIPQSDLSILKQIEQCSFINPDCKRYLLAVDLPQGAKGVLQHGLSIEQEKSGNSTPLILSIKSQSPSPQVQAPAQQGASLSSAYIPETGVSTVTKKSIVPSRTGTFGSSSAAHAPQGIDSMPSSGCNTEYELQKYPTLAYRADSAPSQYHHQYDQQWASHSQCPEDNGNNRDQNHYKGGDQDAYKGASWERDSSQPYNDYAGPPSLPKQQSNTHSWEQKQGPPSYQGEPYSHDDSNTNGWTSFNGSLGTSYSSQQQQQQQLVQQQAQQQAQQLVNKEVQQQTHPANASTSTPSLVNPSVSAATTAPERQEQVSRRIIDDLFASFKPTDFSSSTISIPTGPSAPNPASASSTRTTGGNKDDNVAPLRAMSSSPSTTASLSTSLPRGPSAFATDLFPSKAVADASKQTADLFPEKVIPNLPRGPQLYRKSGVSKVSKPVLSRPSSSNGPSNLAERIWDSNQSDANPRR